jgi:hypothetical protein
VGKTFASGVFGASTDLTSRVFVFNGDLLPLSGVWFSPGNASLLWDNTYLGNTVINQTGAFSTSITVPASAAGQHTLTVQDATTTISVNVAYVPTLATDYANTEMWHQSDFSINISPDSPVNETFYRINAGDVQNITANGQPIINTEGTNNTLEYWSTWNPNAATLAETRHASITGIQLDKTAPVGTVSTNSLSESKTVTLYTSATDSVSGVTSMRFSNDNNSWSSWEPYGTVKTWGLDGSNGVKTIYAQFQNAAGLVSTYNCMVTLLTPTQTPTATPKPTQTPTATPTPPTTATPTVIPASTVNPSPSAIPELPLIVAILAVAGASLFLLLMAKKRAKRPSRSPIKSLYFFKSISGCQKVIIRSVSTENRHGI